MNNHDNTTNNNINNVANSNRYQQTLDEIKAAGGSPEYIKALANNYPDGKFPSGLNAEQTYNSIYETLKTYTHSRDNDTLEINSLCTKEDLKAIVTKNIKEMDDADAIKYLASVSLVFNHINNSDTAISSADITAEYDKLIQDQADTDPQSIINNLVDSLDPSGINNFINICDDVTTNLNNNPAENENTDTYCNATIDTIENHFSKLDELTTETTAIYSVILQSNDPEVPTDLNPGVLAAEYAAYKDTQTVSQMRSNETISEETSTRLLGKIGRAFAKCLACAAKILYWGAAIFIGSIFTNLAASIGVPTFLLYVIFAASLRMSQVEYNNNLYEDIINYSSENFVKKARDSKFGQCIKNLWNNAAEKIKTKKQARKARKAQRTGNDAILLKA